LKAGAFKSRTSYELMLIISVGFTGSGETLNKGGIPVFLLLCLLVRLGFGFLADILIVCGF
jgi:hypothetical protein